MWLKISPIVRPHLLMTRGIRLIFLLIDAVHSLILELFTYTLWALGVEASETWGRR